MSDKNKKIKNYLEINDIKRAVGIWPLGVTPDPSDNNLEPLTPEEVKNAVVLLALYLQSWDEDFSETSIQRNRGTCRSYQFEVLKHLEEKNLIYQIEDRQNIVLFPGAQRIAESLKTMFFDMLGVNHD